MRLEHFSHCQISPICMRGSPLFSVMSEAILVVVVIKRSNECDGKLKQQLLRNLISPINVRGVVHTGCLQHHQRTIEDRRCSISRPKIQTTLKVTWGNQNRTDRSDDLCKARQQWRQPATRYQNDILASRSLKKKNNTVHFGLEKSLKNCLARPNALAVSLLLHH